MLYTKLKFNEHDGDIKRMFTYTPMLLLVNEHSVQLDRDLGVCRRDNEIPI
jgi:hypothetical protein